MRFLSIVVIGLMLGCAGKETKSVTREPARAEPLAKYVQIAISMRESDKRISEVRPFYEKLGFVAVEEGGEPVPFVVMSDGIIHLRLDECEFASPRLDYYTSDAPKQLKRLEALGISYSTEMACARKRWVTNFIDPNGQQLAIIQAARAPIPQPKKSTALCGTFGEFSIHTENRDRSIEWYRNLGFAAMKFEKPHPWAILTDGHMVIGLHQSRVPSRDQSRLGAPEFTRTTITYFSRDSAERIAKLKSMGLKFTNEQKNAQGKVNNASLMAPDRQMFFVFEE